MASKWLSSPLARLAFLTGGTVLLTLGISRNENEWLWIGGFLIALAIYLFYASQKQLREKSWLMLGSYPQQGLFFPPSYAWLHRRRTYSAKCAQRVRCHDGRAETTDGTTGTVL